MATVTPNGIATPTPFLPLDPTAIANILWSTTAPNGIATPTPFLPLDPTAIANILWSTTAPNGIATPTPFLPLDPTAIANIPRSTAAPTWRNFPGPRVQPAVPIPPPVEISEQPAGQVNVLLLGSDQRPYEGGFRTDTILLLTLNPNQGIVNLTSFPRDLYVYIPGWSMNRINTAYQRGGFGLTTATFEYNFGVRPDYYMVINFWVFVQFIDNLGGINVNVSKPLTDHRDGYGKFFIPAGIVHMDGDTSLWYVRARYTTSDFDRARRQQEVLLAIFKRIISLDALGRFPELYGLYHQNVTTNIELNDITPLLGMATQVGNDSSLIHPYFIGREHTTPYTIPSTGANVLLPNREAVLEVIRAALNAP